MTQLGVREMGQKPFEVAVGCAMPGLPTGGDIERIGERLDQARRRAPEVVRTAVSGPAAFKDRAYVLESRFVVWADDGERAVTTVGTLLDGAKIAYSGLRLSGRALTDADAPRPSAGAAGHPPASGTRVGTPRPSGAKAAGKVRAPKRASTGAARAKKAPPRRRAAARGKRKPARPRRKR